MRYFVPAIERLQAKPGIHLTKWRPPRRATQEADEKNLFFVV